MQTSRQFQWIAAALACASWLVPAPCLYSAPPGDGRPSSSQPATGRLVDLALAPGGRLEGQLVTATGQPLAGELVVLQHVAGGQRRETRSDAQGQFRLAGLSAGVVQVTGAGAAQLCRCWTHTAAPPAATDRVLLVATDGVERGQQPIRNLFFSRPILLGLIIAAAIAIPIAVHNAGDDDAS